MAQCIPGSRRLGAVVVGNALMDRVFRLSNPVMPGTGAWVIDERGYPGGVEANVAAALRALDIPVGAVTPLGDDTDADLIINDMVGRGIDVTHVIRVPGGQTAYCLVLTAPDADRIILGGGTGIRNMVLGPDDLDYISKWSVCFTSGYVPIRVVDDLAQLRNKTGMMLAFDLPDTFDDLEVRGFTRGDVNRIWPSLDLFMTNRAGALSYAKTGDLNAALEFLVRRRPARAAVTDGANGSWLISKDRCEHFAALPVEAIDPTGAGDAYHAALIAAWLLEGKTASEAGAFASAAGALNCRAEGARTALPTRAEIQQLLAQVITSTEAPVTAQGHISTDVFHNLTEGAPTEVRKNKKGR